jgi:hypothetical protein
MEERQLELEAKPSDPGSVGVDGGDSTTRGR